jgi:hypothetical protein
MISSCACDLRSHFHVAWRDQNLGGLVSAGSLRPDARGGSAGERERIDRSGGGRGDSSAFAAAERLRKRTIAGLFNGSARAGKKLTVTAESIICRVGNVDITARSCEMTFDKGKRTLKGRQANEVNATLAAAGAVAQGAAGSMIQTVTKLSCTLDPNIIKHNAGGGADCSFATDR